MTPEPVNTLTLEQLLRVLSVWRDRYGGQWPVYVNRTGSVVAVQFEQDDQFHTLVNVSVKYAD